MPIRVVKVGGSLLDFERLPKTLRAWLAAQPPAFNVLVAGGGKLADEIRAADQRFQLGEETAHWLCIDLLDTTARVLSALMPEADLVTSWKELQSNISSFGRAKNIQPRPRRGGHDRQPVNHPDERRTPQFAHAKNSRKMVDERAEITYATWVFSPVRFLREDEQHQSGVVLPHGWCVTSDSIAARIAEVLGADELVLLKSAAPPVGGLRDPGYVDQHFCDAPRAIGCVRAVNLRIWAS